MKCFFVVLSLLAVVSTKAQTRLQPVFDGKEYVDLLSLTYYSKINKDSMRGLRSSYSYTMVYRSEQVGLMNRWTLYLRNDQVGVIDLRGTVNQTVSWLANFYAAMIPATGVLQLNDSTKFEYQLAADPKAAVHVGWTVALGYLAPDIVKKIQQYYTEKRITEFIIFGHSQGGALASLLRSYLEYERQKGHIPPDIRLKTYCSATPKTGNMYYAYDFDFINRNGWAYTIVNTADWVPELPYSIQQVSDLNQPNPISDAGSLLNKQKFLVRVAGKSIYNKLERKPRKAQRKYEKYVGHTLYKRAIKKALPQLKEPEYVHTSNYMRTGTPIVLIPDDGYKLKFSGEQHYFVNHMFQPYYYLVSLYYGNTN